MALAVVSTQQFATPSGGTSPSFDSTGANLIAVFLAYGGTPTVSDNKGNTYSAKTPGANTVTGRWYISEGSNLVSVGTGHTITIGGGSTASAGLVLAISGAAAAAPVVELGSTSLNSATSATFGVNETPSADGWMALYATALQTPTITGAAAGSGWTLPRWLSGGSGQYGFLCSYKIQTTATLIPSSEVFASWTGATSGQNVAIFIKPSAGGSESITLGSPSAFEVHQRSGSTGSIQISGNVSGTTEDIEASFNGGAYVTIASAVAPGSFSGTLTGQAQGQGTLTVRKKTTTATQATVANVGIGDVFLDGGDSRDEGRGTNGQAYSHATLKAAMFKAGAWAELTEVAGAGTYMPLLATHIMASQGVPVAFIRTGAGGTDVAGTNNTWAKPNAQYSAAITAVANSTVSAVKAALFLLGPNAIVNANNAAISLATYRTALDTLASNLAADVAGAPKLFLDVCGEVGTGSPPDRRTAQDNIRGADLSAWNNNGAAIKPGPVLIDQDYSDNVHPLTDAQLKQVADRFWPSLSENLYGGSAGRGPRVVSAYWNLARTQITVVFDRVLKTGLTHATQPWIVKDNGSAMTVSSVAYHGSNTSALIVTVSAAATGAANTTTLSFASGDDAVGRVVPLSTDITLPSTGTINLPAEPIYAYAVAENGTQAASPGAASLTVTGYAPTLAQSTGNAASPGACVLTVQGYAPTIVRTGAALISDLQAVLNGLAAGGSWYQLNEQQPATLPYIVFSRVPSPANVTLQGPSNLQNTHIQIDVYSRTVQELVDLGNQVEAALVAASFTNVQLSSRDLYEAETKLRRTCYEYSVWSSN